MTQKAIKKLETLRGTTARYAQTVQRTLSPRGSSRKESSAIAESAAKYYPALKKLAEK